MNDGMQAVLDKGVETVLRAKRRNYPCHVNRISRLGHPCERYLYHCRVDWDKAAPVSNGLQGVFETGNILEPVIERIISEVGAAAEPPFRVVGQQTQTRDNLLDRHQISGTCDGFWQVLDGPHWRTQAVVDFKTCSPNIFQSLDGIESLNRYPWTRLYIDQVLVYAFAHSTDNAFLDGLLAFVNKGNLWEIKLIPIPFDLERVEGLIQKADRVNVAVETGQAPPKLNQPETCNRCEYAHVCLPELTSDGTLQISTDSGLEELLEERRQTEAAWSRHNIIDRHLKKVLIEGQDLVCGPFVIRWSEKSRKETIQPACTYWQKKIEYIAPGTEQEPQE